MNEIGMTSLINRTAYYRGTNRTWIMNSNTPYTIENVRRDGYGEITHVMFDNKQWVGIDKIELIKPSVSDWEKDLFTKAAGGHREILVNEIKRHKERLAELETALKVIDSL